MKNNVSTGTASGNSANLANNRPTLLARPQLTSVSDADGFSENGILSRLDSQQGDSAGRFGANKPGQSNNQRIPGSKWLAVGAVFAAAVLAGLLINQFGAGSDSDKPDTQMASNGNSPANTLPGISANEPSPGKSPLPQDNTATAAGASLVADPFAPAPAVAPPSPAAQIVNEPLPESRLANPELPARQTSMTAALEAGVQPPAAALQKALNSKPTPAPKLTAAESTAQRADAAKKAALDKARAAEAAIADKDVNLLAAVIAHDKNASSKIVGNTAKTGVSNRPGTNPATAARFEVPRPVTSTGEKTARPGLPNRDSVAANNTSNANRDIVARNAAEPTDSLLKRCSALGFVESQLCRLRICSGQWETDFACKASLSSSAATAGPASAEAANARAQPPVSLPMR